MLLYVLRQLLKHRAGSATASRARGNLWRECSQTQRLQNVLRHAHFQSVRSPSGSGVSDTRMVSPMPCCSKMPSAADEDTMPFEPMPASVSPRLQRKGCFVQPVRYRH